MARIFKTDDYDKFKMHPANRNIDPSHLNTLLKSIKRHNLLHENPIKVKDEDDGTYTILDGQHRFASANILNTKIYYIITEDMDISDVPSYQTSKKWTYDDFLKHYCYYDLQDYKIYAGYQKQSGWSHNCLMMLLAGHSKGVMTAFKNGSFKIIRSIEEANDKMNKVNSFSQYFKHYKSRGFVTAMLRIINTVDEYKHDQMMQNMQYLSERLVKCTDTESYLRLLEKLYNYKTTGRYVRFI